MAKLDSDLEMQISDNNEKRWQKLIPTWKCKYLTKMKKMAKLDRDLEMQISDKRYRWR